MLPYEREMLLYPRVCATCYMDQGSKLSQCEQCESVFFCCEEHIPKNHSAWCSDLKTLLDINLEQAFNGNIQCALPHQLIKEYEDLPPSMKVRSSISTRNYKNQKLNKSMKEWKVITFVFRNFSLQK